MRWPEWFVIIFMPILAYMFLRPCKPFDPWEDAFRAPKTPKTQVPDMDYQLKVSIEVAGTDQRVVAEQAIYKLDVAACAKTLRKAREAAAALTGLALNPSPIAERVSHDSFECPIEPGVYLSRRFGEWEYTGILIVEGRAPFLTARVVEFANAVIRSRQHQPDVPEAMRAEYEASLESNEKDRFRQVYGPKLDLANACPVIRQTVAMKPGSNP